jgi:shikimate kinase
MPQQVVTNQQIVIIGFMGTGKTTVAHELGHQLNYLAVDLDELITRRESRSPSEIIDQDGESEFRRIEAQLLSEVLEEGRACIIAVGGGAWTIAANRQLIVERGAFTVWLDADFELCWKRIESGSGARPLARSREMAERLYGRRRPVYELADLRVALAEGDSAAEIAAKIFNKILRRQ